MSDHSTTRSGAPKPSGFVQLPRRSRGSANSEEFGPTSSEAISSVQQIETGQGSNQHKAKVKYSRLKRRILSHVAAVRIIALLLILSFLFLIIFFIAKASAKFDIPLYYNVVYNFVKAPVSQLPSENGRTNILVMGKAGGEHDGPDLTDTIMLVSVGLAANDIKIISIPRDTWVPEMRAKINSAYYWGIQKNVGGINFAKAETSQIVGVPIQYGAVIDFSGFKEIIDVLGGIEVNIENDFTDYYYPIAGREDDKCGGRDPKFMCRYETLTFKKGALFMNGETALKFVRSRHAEGIEGTDIAREARQGKVIEALKDKLSDKNTYMNLNKDLVLMRVVLKSIQTDIDYPTAAILARRVYDSQDSIKSYLIPEDLLVNVKPSPAYDMQAVFTPRLGNGRWKEINDWVLSQLN